MHSILNKIKKLKGVNIIQFIYYNFICKNIKRYGKGYIIPYKGTVISLSDEAQIDLYDGHFFVNFKKPHGSNAECYVILRSNSRLTLRDTTFLYYMATIELHENAEITIGSAPVINTGCVILASKRISIGHGVIMARQVFVYDSDHHPIFDSAGTVINEAQDVVIGNHVWLGLRSTVLKGSHIGDGAVVAAGAIVVGGNIKGGSMACGIPAKERSSIIWGTAPERSCQNDCEVSVHTN